MTRSTRSLAVMAAISLLLIPGATLAADASVAPSAPASSEAPATFPRLEGVRWHIDAFNAEDGGMSGPWADATFTFVEGQLTGSTGCNDLVGGYTLDGDALTISVTAPAEASCLDGDIAVQEMAILAQLPQVTSFSFDDAELSLIDGFGNTVIRLKALQTGSWTPMYGGAEPMPQGDVTLMFSDSGVSGQGPCNSYAGPFLQDGASIAIGPIESTRASCPDLELETEFLSDLELARSYAMQAGDLVLFDDQGAEIRRFAQVRTGD